MDCDLRKPKIHQHFQTVNQADKTLKTQIEGLFLWRAPEVNDPTVFIEKEFPSLLEKYGKQFDLVLIDSAPVNIVADTATLLREDLPVLLESSNMTYKPLFTSVVLRKLALRYKTLSL